MADTNFSNGTVIVPAWLNDVNEVTYKVNTGITGAVQRDTVDKLKDYINVKDFGAVGDGSDEYTKILAAWNYCLANGKSLYFPAGTYNSGIQNMPFKNPTFPATTTLDCKNIYIFGDGPDTVLKSDSVNGADVISLYFVKNIHIRNLSLTASISGSVAGSNGISIVGAFDNITVDNVWAYNLAYVDKTTYLDGGKAFTIQPGVPAAECGSARARIFAKGCVYAAGVEVDISNWATKTHAISIDYVAEDCYAGVEFIATEATSALSPGMTCGVSFFGKTINCQHNVIINRAHGIELDNNIITTKSKAARKLNPSGLAWSSTDAIVDGSVVAYAKNSQIKVWGDLGACDYKVRVGGASAGASGLSTATDNCDLYFDIGGTAAVADYDSISSGGGTLTNSDLYVSTTTTTSLPTNIYSNSNNNIVTIGTTARLNNAIIGNSLKFGYTDGITTYNSIDRDTLGLYFSQTGGSSNDIAVLGVKDHLATKKWFVRNDGGMATANRNNATSVSTVKQVLPIYDTTNTLVGYIPIYTSFA